MNQHPHLNHGQNSKGLCKQGEGTSVSARVV
jgi:hypothetical protein